MLTSTPCRSSAQVYNWLSRFVNLERGQKPKNFGIEGMNALAELAGRPEKCAPSFHVAGSKGKGSVTGMIGAILQSSGIKTARYSSPHVSDFRERLCLGAGFFDEDIYVSAGNELIEIYEKSKKSGKAVFAGEDPSFFELLTLWFFLCARLSGCEALAVETGMGGRLDSTNILDPLVSVITIIELEHTEFLGTTIPAIAGEKAGIIKPGRPVVLAEQSPSAFKVFSEKAADSGSPLVYFPDNAEILDISVAQNGTGFSLGFKKNSCFKGETIRGLFVPIPGEVQAYNAGLAALAVKTAYPDIKCEDIREGLANFLLPARFERICGKPQIIIDGAHTGRSMELCLNTFTALYGSGNILIFGCALGKDVLSMAELCAPCFSTIIITAPGAFKESRPGEIYDVFAGVAKNTGAKTELFLIPETKEAISKAINTALEKGLSILGAGSFYLAAEIKKAVGG